MSLKDFSAEGYISLIAGALFSVGILGLGFYFVSGCKPNDIPLHLHPIVEESAETLAETVLGLEPGTIEIDLTPESKEDKNEH